MGGMVLETSTNDIMEAIIEMSKLEQATRNNNIKA